MKIYIGSSYNYWGEFTPDMLFEKTAKDAQIGGGETAMLQIATELASNSRNDVTVFYDIAYYGDYYGVHYLPTNLMIPMICQTDFDVFISWDAPYLFRYADRAKCRVLAFQLNDPQVGVLDWAVDLYMHPSQWHLKRSRLSAPEITASKQIAGLTNGIDYYRYKSDCERDPYRVIYSSSPDRGLHHLLRIWPEIVSRVPQANLHVYYDMKKWLNAEAELAKSGVRTITSERADILRRQLASNLPSVHVHGGIGQTRLAEEQMRSRILAYPCDPVRPTEGFSMTVLEGIVSGCKVITTNADAFPELWEGKPNVTMIPLPVEDDVWVNTIVDVLRSPMDNQKFGDLKLSWMALARGWEREISKCLQNKAAP